MPVVCFYTGWGVRNGMQGMDGKAYSWPERYFAIGRLHQGAQTCLSCLKDIPDCARAGKKWHKKSH